MPGTGEVRQRETLDGRIFITIARRMAIAFPDDASCVGIGRELHHAKRCDCPGEGVAFPTRADHRVDLIVGRLR